MFVIGVDGFVNVDGIFLSVSDMDRTKYFESTLSVLNKLFFVEKKNCREKNIPLRREAIKIILTLKKT